MIVVAGDKIAEQSSELRSSSSQSKMTEQTVRRIRIVVLPAIINEDGN